MSFYRTLLAAIAAVAIASPVFAEDAPATTTTSTTETTAPAADAAAQTTTTTTTTSASDTSTEAKVSLNKATAKELMKVKGINAAKARAIVAYRKKHGEFKTIDDLNNVKGFKKMKPETMKEVQEQVTVE